MTKKLVPDSYVSLRENLSRGEVAAFVGAGLSMGAMQAIRIGLKHPDLFCSIGWFSGIERNFDPKSSFDGALADGLGPAAVALEDLRDGGGARLDPDVGLEPRVLLAHRHDRVRAAAEIAFQSTLLEVAKDTVADFR